MERYAHQEIELLGARIGRQSSKDRKMILLLYDEVLGGTQADVGDTEAIGIVCYSAEAL